MSDKSLPKPVVPQDPQTPATPLATGAVKPQANPSQMPPSARISKPQPQGSSLSQKPGTPPPTMNPPAGMKPPLPGKPPSFPTQPSATSLPKKDATKPPASNLAKEGSQQKSAPKKKSSSLANVKESPFKYLPFVVGGLVLLFIVWLIISRIMRNRTSSVDTTDQQPTARKTVPTETAITYWGLWEPDNAVRSVLDKFEEANPGTTVNYVKQSHKDYRERLQTAIASGNGPDVFRYHASWTPMLSEELASMPQSVMTAAEYQEIFYPIAAKMLNIDGRIVGIPLMYEGLGLYYNKEMLTAANAEPPKTWAEVKTLANKLTVREGDTLKRGGLAIGNASNVEHFADILGLLMLQNGADPSDPTSKEAQDALSFYTNFVKEDEIWDGKLPSSTVAFARGDVAMMFAPSWRAHEVQTMNPNLDFGITTLPRLGDDRLAWATFWAEGVSSKSDNSDIAWALLDFLSSKEIQQELYSAQSQIRSFGEIYSRADLANELADNELVAPYLEDAPDASGWYLSSYTHDNGINDLLIKYYQDAINAVLGGKTVEDALETVGQGANQVLRQYGVE